MTPELAAAIYDRLLPGWREAPLVSGNRRVRCPLHNDEHPSLDVHPQKFVWICRTGCGGGGALDLAARVLGEKGAQALLAELDGKKGGGQTRRDPVEVLGEPTPAQIKALERSRRITSAQTLPRAGARLVRAWGEGWLGLPNLDGGWKLLALDGNGVTRLDEPGKLVRRNAGRVSLFVSPDLRSRNGGSISRLYDVEGESDALACIDRGMVAVLAGTGGAGSLAGHELHVDRLSALQPEEVVVVGDLDAPGSQGARKRAEWWLNRGVPARVLQLPAALGPGGDVRDFLLGSAGRDGEAARQPLGGAADLDALADQAELRRPESYRASGAYRASSEQQREGAYRAYRASPENRWPHPTAPEAFHGLAGDFVTLVEPHTEADPAALLIQFLVMAGSVFGRKRYFTVEEDRHTTNLYAAIVGESSKARKGTSKSRTLVRFAAVDQGWAEERVLTGLASGEGLIWAVRDPIMKREPVRQSGRITGYQEVESDPGVPDKRLLVFEPELARVLRVIAREGSTLSAVLRDAWDRGHLRILTKNSPANATGAHVSIIGHVTTDELRRELALTDAASGFGNRFLWILARRSKLLPDGGRLQDVDFSPFTRGLTQAVNFAGIAGELRRSAQAAQRWREVYAALSESQPGLFGAVTSRAEAQVVRLSLIYALLDRSESIEPVHLEAALAVWRFAEASAGYIFGDALGDPVADEILRALRAAGDAGMSRNEIREHFGRHRRSDDIGRALDLLFRHRRAYWTSEPTNGRPAERWFAKGSGCAKSAIGADSLVSEVGPPEPARNGEEAPGASVRR